MCGGESLTCGLRSGQIGGYAGDRFTEPCSIPPFTCDAPTRMKSEEHHASSDNHRSVDDKPTPFWQSSLPRVAESVLFPGILGA